ncbi:MAG: hypothetical protein P1Q69_06630 [Candidatus Thorarchaeota archaeon]|nr:hypothetical protein [Candidatus Thorarchaeota archaeon]
MKLETMSFLICLLVVAPMGIIPLSAPITSNLVVVMNNDDGVRSAVNAIQEGMKNIQIVTFGSLEFILSISRVIGKTVWVSHGYEDGILTPDSKVGWEQFSSCIKTTPGKDIVLACESSNVKKYISDHDAMVFDGAVEARVTGFAVAALLTAYSKGFEHSDTQKCIDKAFDVVNDLATGVSEPVLLGAIPTWWLIIKIALIGVLTGWYFTTAESQIPAAFAEAAHPILLILAITLIFNTFASLLLLWVQSAYPGISSFLSIVSVFLNLFAGLAIQKILQGALPGGAYLLSLTAGKVASLVGAGASWAQPWVRAAFAASAAIIMVSIIDFLVVTVFTLM